MGLTCVLAVCCLERTGPNTDSMEAVFNALIRALLREQGTVPPGSVLDAGANNGVWTIMSAETVPGRVIHAVEPLMVNVQHIRRTYASAHPNILVTHGDLGEADHRVSGAGLQGSNADARITTNQNSRLVQGDHSSSNTTIPINTIDTLFATDKLGFAHIDIKRGSELSILQGALQVIARDQPIFSIKVHVQQDLNFSRRLVALVRSLGYVVFSVPEVCGQRMDCRNILCLPRSRRAVYEGSSVLDLAVASRRLFPVDDIADHGFSCCVPGGGCPSCIGQEVSLWLESELHKWTPTMTHKWAGTRPIPSLDVLLSAFATWKGSAPGGAIDIASNVSTHLLLPAPPIVGLRSPSVLPANAISACEGELDKWCSKNCRDHRGESVAWRAFGHPNRPWSSPNEELWRCLPARSVIAARYHNSSQYCTRHGPLHGIRQNHPACRDLKIVRANSALVYGEEACRGALDLWCSQHCNQHQTHAFVARLGFGDPSQTWSGPSTAMWRCYPARAVLPSGFHFTNKYCTRDRQLRQILDTHDACRSAPTIRSAEPLRYVAPLPLAEAATDHSKQKQTECGQLDGWEEISSCRAVAANACVRCNFSLIVTSSSPACAPSTHLLHQARICSNDGCRGPSRIAQMAESCSKLPASKSGQPRLLLVIDKACNGCFEDPKSKRPPGSAHQNVWHRITRMVLEGGDRTYVCRVPCAMSHTDV